MSQRLLDKFGTFCCELLARFGERVRIGGRLPGVLLAYGSTGRFAQRFLL
jgi:hypothetical protein